MEVEDRRKFFLIVGIFFSFLLILVAATVATQRTSFTGRASSPGSGALLSLENSYLFASPLSAEANGESIIRITVFLMNSQGLGVAGQKVVLKSSGLVNITATAETTYNFGRATFDLTANTPGDYTISAAVSGAILPQTVPVVFR